ncbi:hypothetical protein [Ferrimonas sp. YFM]|uniref:hypothetical protein n=1 Tax=Ferrimonas sp. YFM TaxID=3028878 RepID=UPI0025733E16|nr:hypothetical protein [Ferrimonas sp. YFM]BDY05456.1 hypothetical protein F0521_24970 [Ferrimonas sp. YFM]
MSKLLDYINELDSNADLLDAHKKDPESTMKTYGLSDEEIAAVMSGDSDKIRALSGANSDQDLVNVVQVQQK